MVQRTCDVSVVIPAHNAHKYLAAALNSVADQSLPPREIIVVDDGSTDTTAEIAAGYARRSVTLLRQPQRGSAAARNAGVLAASQPYLAFLDADDLWSPRKLAEQIAPLEADCDLLGLFGHMQNFVSPDLTAEQRDALICPEKVMPGYCAGTLLIRRDAFLRAGLFDETLHAGEFIAWYSTAQQLGMRFMLMPGTLLQRRIHLTNTTRVSRNARDAAYLQMVRKHLQKRTRAD
tara:strand:- start:4344 stop:5042 length:699 start_codon:yes stop_codon:yes gene_type:complete